MARSILAILTILIFTGVALVGFAMVSEGHPHIMCPAEQIQGGRCSFLNPLAVFTFHVQAFQGFAAAIFAASALAAFLIFSVLPALFSIVGSDPTMRFWGLVSVDFSAVLTDRPFLRWLSLHENSPSYY